MATVRNWWMKLILHLVPNQNSSILFFRNDRPRDDGTLRSMYLLMLLLGVTASASAIYQSYTSHMSIDINHSISHISVTYHWYQSYISQISVTYQSYMYQSYVSHIGSAGQRRPKGQTCSLWQACSHKKCNYMEPSCFTLGLEFFGHIYLLRQLWMRPWIVYSW